jgi:hypothetical protein
MQLPAPQEGKRRFQVFVQAYSELIRDGLVFVAWTVVALVAGGISFLILRVTWWLLLLALRALGEI